MLSYKNISVGVDIGNFSVKVVGLRKERLSKKRVLTFGVENIPENATNQQISELIQKTMKKARITSTQVNISLSGPNVSYRFIRLPIMRRTELKATLELELEKYIPFKANEVIWDFRILEPVVVPVVGRQVIVFLVAAKKDFIEKRMSIIKAAGLIPQLIDVDTSALMNAYNFINRGKDKKLTALLNIGSHCSNLIVVKKDVPQFARDILLGGRDITQIIAERLHLTFSTAESMKYRLGQEDNDILRLIRIVLENLCNEMSISFEYIKKERNEEVKTVYISGGCLHLYDIKKFLDSRLDVKVNRWNLEQVFKVDSELSSEKLEEISSDLIVAIGLALE